MRKKAQDLIITVSAFGLLIMLGVGAVTICFGLVIPSRTMVMVGDEYGYTEVVVQPGDTLWSIARAQVPNEDPRDVVGSIKELNELISADIFPGQVLTLQIKQKIEPLQFVDGNIR